MQTTTTDTQPTTSSRAALDTDIRSLVTRHHLEPAFADDLIARGAGDAEARAAILDRLAARDAVGTRTRTPSVEFGYDSGDPQTQIRGMAEVLHTRYGGPAPSEQARQFSGMKLTDMARTLLECRGINAKRLTAPEVIERALHTTSDFPALLTESGNRFLRQTYGAYAGGLRRVAKQTTAVDFRAKSSLQLGEAPTLEKVNEHGEFKHGSMAKSKESYSLGTYGRIFGITRQALVNDDLGAFATMATRFGRSALEFENKFLVDLLASNPTMDDSVALFDAAHGNLAGTGGAISVETLGAARKAMRLQKGLDGVTPIDATPRYLIVPAALETVAEQYLATLWAGDAAKANPFSGALELVVDPRLDAKSITAWYAAADPSALDTIEYAYLESAQGPEIELRPGFEVDGVEIKCRLDYGAGILDFRGLYKNAGQ